MILDLQAAEDVTLVGGKAASLGRLLRQNINTPRGFVITTQVKFPLTKPTKTAILAKFDQTFPSADTKVAVRSSGTPEDGSWQSFAGQFDTFLNVDRRRLIPKIEQVHASINSARSQSYSQITSRSMAIIVQEMVAADISGVAFSANIITHQPDEIIIEATSGLGEKLVSGLVTPDLFIVDKTSGQVTTHEAGAKQITLSPQNLESLVDLVIRIERFAGFPVDIEWAIRHNQLYCMQVRPITTL